MRMLERYDVGFAAARARIADALEGPQPGPAERLFRWVEAEDINPWEIFADPALARGMGTAEGAVGVLHSLNHALDDGEISFPITRAHGPRIALLDRREPGFEAAFLRQIEAHGHGEEAVETHRVTGFCTDMDDFMEDFDRAQAERSASVADFLRPES